jgi:trehalose 6-phosphate synthase
VSKRIVHISNRVDIPQPGVATAGGLDEVISRPPNGYDVVRIGWNGNIVNDDEHIPSIVSVTQREKTTYITFDLSRTQYEKYYGGTSNGFLWPLFHFRTDIASQGYSCEDNEVYCQVNKAIANVSKDYIHAGDTIMVHDYHLIPLGKELRKEGLKNPMGFFLHIPAPSADLLEELTQPEQEFIYSLLGNLHSYDLVGLQAKRDFEAINTILGKKIGVEDAPNAYEHKVIADSRQVFSKVSTHFGVYPVIGLVSQYEKQAEVWNKKIETKAFLRSVCSRSDVDIISLERLDYTKGIPNKFTAVADCIYKHGVNPDDIHFLQVAPFGRECVPAYQYEKATIKMAHGFLSHVFGGVSCLHLEKVRREIMLGLYRGSNIGLVTPLRDGYNLVAAEYLSAQDPQKPGVLVLSKFAGAAEVLKDAAILVNPRRSDDIARGIMEARMLSLDEKKELHQNGMKALHAKTNSDWQQALIETTIEIAQQKRLLPQPV